MIRQMYDVVMDPKNTPFRALPPKVRFQYMMILSYLWGAPQPVRVRTTRR